MIEIIAQFAGITYAEADERRRALGDVEGMAETKALVLPAGAGPRLPAAGGRADLEGARGVRVVRLLQGARRGVRAADLPVGLAQGALAGALPGRGAHPRPGHVPQAADPRRRPPAAASPILGLDVNASQRGLRGAASGRRPTTHEPRVRRTVLEDAALTRGGPQGGGWPDGRLGIRLSLAEVKGINEAEIERIVAGPAAYQLADRLLAPRPGVPAGGRAAGAGRRRSTPSTASASAGADGVRRRAGSPAATCCSRWPTSTGTPGRSSGPAGRAGWRAGRAVGGQPAAGPAGPTPAPTSAAERTSSDPDRPRAAGRPRSVTRSAEAGVWARAAGPVAGDPAGPRR